MTTADPIAASEPASRKKFKYTQQLVNMALDEMTQDEVAKICRVSQSIVSGWKNGQARAYEHQIAELRKRYAHRLHRATFRVYLALVKDPVDRMDWEPMRTVKWTETETRTRRVPPPGAVDGATTPKRELVDERYNAEVECSRRETDPEGFRVVQVEGPVALRHTMHIPGAAHPRTGKVEREPVARWLVHHLARDRFVLVRQRRRVHHGLDSSTDNPDPSNGAAVEASDDAARWLSRIEGPMTAGELLQRADAVMGVNAFLGTSLLPFLVRKMLLELGYPVEGVDRISADA